TYLTMVNSEVNNAELMTPPSTSMMIEALPNRLAIPRPTSTASNPAANAQTCTTTQLPDISMPIDAPNAAPASTPSRPGETRGLRNTAWNAAPADARAAPIRTAAAILG